MSGTVVHSGPVNNYLDLFEWLTANGAEFWAEHLRKDINAGLSFARYGDLPKWLELVENSPALHPTHFDFQQAVKIGSADDLSPTQKEQLEQVLVGLMPWRKGPFELYGIHLDAEWQSNRKWDRISTKISPLKDRVVLDVGCGNGYYMLRMLGMGAARVIGVDPSPRFVVQFDLLKKLIAQEIPAHLLPIRAEQLPSNCPLFDTAFSMGVLYHRREPCAHLQEVAQVLKPGGELILETLIIEGQAGDCLIPAERYAQMRNVWSIPSLKTLLGWVENCGFEQIEVLDINQTSTEEQRQTPWMKFQSLSDFLDPVDPCKTVEGYPAPIRAAIRAVKS